MDRELVMFILLVLAAAMVIYIAELGDRRRKLQIHPCGCAWPSDEWEDCPGRITCRHGISYDFQVVPFWFGHRSYETWTKH